MADVGAAPGLDAALIDELWEAVHEWNRWQALFNLAEQDEVEERALHLEAARRRVQRLLRKLRGDPPSSAGSSAGVCSSPSPPAT